MNQTQKRKSSKKKKKNKGLRILGVIGICLAFLVVLCLITIMLLLKGPSSAAKVIFVNSCNESSAMKWIPYMFLSDSEVKEIINSSGMKEVDEGVSSNTELIDTSNVSEDPIEIIDVKGSSFRGKLMIIHDPSKVFLGTIPEFYEGTGEVVADIIKNYDGVIAGVNGGDFVDMGSYSYTAMPLGAIISNGEVVFSEYGYDEYYHLAGFTEDNKFFMGNITLTEALEMGVRDAVYTKHDTGPFLVMDGEALINEVPGSATYGGGKNPRTAIGQRSDGAVLLLVVDGRQANSLGATFKDLAYTMLEYGAVNACAMDGGTSSQMVYNGEILNHPYSPTGPRRCPTAWLVRE